MPAVPIVSPRIFPRLPGFMGTAAGGTTSTLSGLYIPVMNGERIDRFGIQYGRHVLQAAGAAGQFCTFRMNIPDEVSVSGIRIYNQTTPARGYSVFGMGLNPNIFAIAGPTADVAFPLNALPGNTSRCDLAHGLHSASPSGGNAFRMSFPVESNPMHVDTIVGPQSLILANILDAVTFAISIQWTELTDQT